MASAYEKYIYFFFCRCWTSYEGYPVEYSFASLENMYIDLFAVSKGRQFEPPAPFTCTLH